MEKIFEARTEREAVEKAIQTFGVNEEYIEIKVLSKKKGNFLGLNGKVVINASVIGLPSTDDALDDSSNDATTTDTTTISHTNNNYSQNNSTVQLTPLTEHQKKEITAIIETLISKMDIDVDVEFYTKDGQLFTSLIIENTSDQNLLIGKNGKTIDALQTIINSIIQSKYDTSLEKVVIEIENYRDKRNNWLISLAQKKADQVLQSKRSYTLEELTPYDRKLIHSTIRDIPGISTKSQGNGYCKRLTIYNEYNE